MKQELFNVQDAAGILRYTPDKLLLLAHTDQIGSVRDKHGKFMFRWHDIAVNMIDRTRRPLRTRERFGARGFGHE